MDAPGRNARRWPYVLLLAPFIGTLWVSTYASKKPELWGIPFFYWYQFAWILAASCITTAVYLLTQRRRGERNGRGGSA